jgi:pimeloyl-ACP methyl ester carboxylesterase
MPFATVNGARLHYTRRGDGDDVVLLCGLGDDVTAWDAQTPVFARQYRVTVLDNRGVGRSSLPDGEFGVADLAGDAAGVLDAVGVRRAHIAGFSMGGAIAQELALSRPDLVSSLVIIGSWCRSDRFFQETIRGIAWSLTIADSARAWLYSFLTWVYSPAVFADGRIDAIVEAALHNPHPQQTDAFCRTARAIADHDTLDRLAGIGAPTLVMVGSDDLLCPPRHARMIAERIPGARLIELAAKAHQPFQEDPDLFNQLLLDYWRETGGGG